MIGILILCCGMAYSLTDESSTVYFPSYFIPADARSAAMGDCFAATGQTVSGTNGNPADLVAANRSELRLDFRYAQFDPNDLAYPANEGLSQSTWSPTYLGGNFRMNGLGFAFSRQESLHTNGDITVTQRGGANPFERYYSDGKQDLSLTNWNSSIAASLSRISIGGTLHVSHLAWQGASRDTYTNYHSQSFGAVTSVDDTATALGFTVGMIASTKSLHFGAIYTRNPKFHLSESIQFLNLDGSFQPVQQMQITYKTPDQLRIGAAFVGQSLIVAADLVHVEYKDFLQDLIVLTGNSRRLIAHTANNWEFHTGAEYQVAFPRNQSVAMIVRGGYYQKQVPNTFFSDASQEREHHVTFGAGMSVAKVRWDLSFDLRAKPNLHSVLRYTQGSAVTLGLGYDFQ